MDTSSLNKVVDSLLSFLNTYGNVILTESFRIVMRQVYANAISCIIWGLFCLTGFVTVSVALKRWWNSYVETLKEKAKDYGKNTGYSDWKKHVDFDDVILQLFLGGVGLTIFGLSTMSLFNNAVMYLINPEWYAVKLILGLVK